MSSSKSDPTQRFYDTYWPKNVPDYNKTRAHVQSIVPQQKYVRAFDGGCGTGVCSLALGEMSEGVVGFDISLGSILTAAHLARSLGRTNIEFCEGSLLEIPFASGTFDLVFSWGVIHHTVSPVRALDELVRILRPGGTIVLAVYLKTPFTFVHETIRHICLGIPPQLRRPVIGGFANLVRLGERLGRVNNMRDDNPWIESQVEDWFFVPEKHFFTIDEMRSLFLSRGLTYEVLSEQTGRYRSSSNFIVRGQRPR